MTPCFIHTPNLTNKWGTFKPNEDHEEPKKDKEQMFLKD
jgi:hypothetical protein